jgi:hypothetical protein
VLEFTGAFAMASAISAVTALALGGQKRWAALTALAMVLLIATPIAGTYALSWLGQNPLGAGVPNVVSVQQRLTLPALEIARLMIPTATILGTMTGTITGLLLLLAGRWAGFVRWSLVGLLPGCVIVLCTSVHSTA